MIAHADLDLRTWVERVLGRVSVVFSMPSDVPREKSVSFVLLDLAADAAVHAPSGRDARLQARARYLVSAHAPDPVDAGGMLAELFFAALEEPGLVVVSDAIAPDLWLALQAAPRPSFFVSLVIRKQRVRPVAKSAGRMEIEVVQTSGLEGVVLGPGDVPLQGVRVDVVGYPLSTKTDAVGRFRFARVPASDAPITLRARSRGGDVELAADEAERDSGPLILRIQPKE